MGMQPNPYESPRESHDRPASNALSDVVAKLSYGVMLFCSAIVGAGAAVYYFSPAETFSGITLAIACVRAFIGGGAWLWFAFAFAPRSAHHHDTNK